MSSLIVSVPDEETRNILGAVPDGVEIVTWDLTTPPPSDLVDMVIFPSFAAPGLISATASVRTRLLQITAIGYDQVAGRLPPGKVLANATTVHETATAELAVTLLLALARDVPRMSRYQDISAWKPFESRGLADTRVLLLGYGGIGRAIAARLDPFEVTLVRVAHRLRDDERGTIHPVTMLPELLGEADAVIVAVPLTNATRGLVDDDFLAAMPDGAIFINISRGKVANTDALVRHATRLRMGLDVTDPEPLPADHPLWQKAALISPHVGGVTAAAAPRLRALLQRQIAHLLAGEDPENIVLRS